MNVPVIAIDGPSASGKGTIAARVAQQLKFHYLDSGALYRLVALAAKRRGIPSDAEARLAAMAEDLKVDFRGEAVWLDHEDVTQEIRSEEIAAGASIMAALPQVRRELLELQRAFRKPPGLVAEGRDMGTIVFPDAVLKIFLTASAQERAERRYKQLREKGMHANLNALLQDIVQRDARDSERTVAPLKKAADAELLDTTARSIDEAVAEVLASYALRSVRV
ncbi:MAG TPA: (d)CMP kinase [Burkholderiales bacterium]|nr:(d)CMP kinase [Burkholderiales bacterium]